MDERDLVRRCRAGDLSAFETLFRQHAQGELNIGGPSPGETIPATFETRVRTMPDGTWEVELVRSWGGGMHNTWTFQVGAEGWVNNLGESGDQLNPIP